MNLKDEVNKIKEKSISHDQKINEIIHLLEPAISNMLRFKTKDPEVRGLIGPTIWETIRTEGLDDAFVAKCIRRCQLAVIRHTTDVVRVPYSSAYDKRTKGLDVPSTLGSDNVPEHPSKEDNFETLLDAIRSADLTQLEAAILSRLLEGDTQSMIAEKMGRSNKYVHDRVKSLRSKIQPIIESFGYHA